MSTYVFLGPTLPIREARRHVDAHFLPPVAQGDVLRVLDRGANVIAIVDGYFELVPSVWHKEILLALESGVHVLGASSMGALRAAELAPFGMKGVGQIYRWFASGRLEDDDEVAVVHGLEEQGYRELSEAMVNVRDRCATAVTSRVVTRRAAREVVAAAKALFYPERRWPRILDDARQAGVATREIQAMAGYLKRERTPSLKARDAVALLQRVAAVISRPHRPFRPRVRTERTTYIGRLRAEVAQPVADEPVGIGLDRADELALLRILMAREALHGSHRVSDTDVQTVEDALRRDLGVLQAADLAQWLERAGLSAEDFDAWMRDEALATRLRGRFRHAVTLQARTEGQRLRARAVAEASRRENP
jgi:hypothetical protein